MDPRIRWPSKGIIDLIEACLREHPRRAATKWQAAVHEAGHMVAYEVEGMVAAHAEISGTPFGRGGWGVMPTALSGRILPRKLIRTISCERRGRC